MSKPPAFQHLQVSVEQRVAVLCLNRPEVLNACNSALHLELQQAVEMAEQDPQVRVLLLRGGGRAFCSGSDLREVGQFRGDAARRYIRLDFATKNRVAACSKPVIAAVHGHVAGGGFELALACDIRIAADDTLFSLPEVRLGTLPGAGGLQRLPAIVGLGIAKEWALSGRRIDADEARRTGLANHVVPLAEHYQQALRFAQDLAQRNPVALALIKRALDPEPPAVDGLVGMFHMLASQACHDTPDYGAQTQDYTNKA